MREDVIKSLCIILSQMSGFIKYFKDGNKNMSFMAEEDDIYLQFSDVWGKINKLLKLKFSTNPIRDNKYIVAMLKIFNDLNKTTFTNEEVPKERNNYACIAVIDIDSVLKIDKKV